MWTGNCFLENIPVIIFCPPFLPVVTFLYDVITLQDLCTQLKDRLQLADYLILPVQRITKYSLLLEDMLKYSIRAGEECDELDVGHSA